MAHKKAVVQVAMVATVTRNVSVLKNLAARQCLPATFLFASAAPGFSPA